MSSFILPLHLRLDLRCFISRLNFASSALFLDPVKGYSFPMTKSSEWKWPYPINVICRGFMKLAPVINKPVLDNRPYNFQTKTFKIMHGCHFFMYCFSSTSGFAISVTGIAVYIRKTILRSITLKCTSLKVDIRSSASGTWTYVSQMAISQCCTKTIPKSSLTTGPSHGSTLLRRLRHRMWQPPTTIREWRITNSLLFDAENDDSSDVNRLNEDIARCARKLSEESFSEFPLFECK